MGLCALEIRLHAAALTFQQDKSEVVVGKAGYKALAVPRTSSSEAYYRSGAAGESEEKQSLSD